MRASLTRVQCLGGKMFSKTNVVTCNFLLGRSQQWRFPQGPNRVSVLERCFSSRERRFEVPPEKLETNFVRSSGAGGQNVNKVNTKVELRFSLQKADWMDEDTKTRLSEMYDKHMNKYNEFIVTSQATRSQQGNLDDALRKLQRMVDRASKPPKQRHFKAGLSEHTKEKRKEHKRHRSEVKQKRKGKGIDD
eukprot:gb/GECG01001279.1/.p1 GENE.gb/GECG01001279.1/~~gb/GECG01001279.1/.p1  ORF type:complete len:191 (+),score=27.43 gb/GECG01001279.1/:1-573(+)